MPNLSRRLRLAASLLSGAMCFLAALSNGLPVALAQDADTSDTRLTFEEHIAPIFEARCQKCHGAEKTEAGLDLRRRFTLEKGGDSGPAIVPGDPDASPLIQRVEALEMPPPEEGPLDEVQRRLLRRWVADGAPLKGADERPLEATDDSRRLTDADRSDWAFNTPVRVPPPAVKAADRVRTPIDAFVLSQLEAQGLSFNPDAPQLVLLRRACFDLLGLPPTENQVVEFLADTDPLAYERLVDRLLDSPRYGERFGRHWLDIAGYADSDGYLAADRLRPEAWRYRDYVIRAHNQDVPYDRFICQQLAGDELADWRTAMELTPEMAESLVATGFLRTASDPTYPGYIEPNEVHQVMADTMQIVGTSLLGLTLQCARCHAHKFDPISQRDYYAFQSLFLPSYDPARWLPSEVRGIPLATEAEQARIAEANRQTDERIAALAAQLAERTTHFQKKIVREHLAVTGSAPPDAIDGLVDPLVAALAFAPDARNDEQKALVASHAPSLAIGEGELAARFAEYTADAAPLHAAIAAEGALRREIVNVRGLVDHEGAAPAAHVLVRGDYRQPGAVVEPGVPEVLAPSGFALAPQPSYKSTGRRRALAEWLTNPNNPLTARTQVNRMWAQHFGRGLVATVANFGRSGAPPSHPELLDWLATEFVRQGWSMKAMHRMMLCSTVYRQSSDWDSSKATVDPENILLWSFRPRRHEGEVLRDSMLAVAGKLNSRMYGPPVPVVASDDGSVVTAKDLEANRRSVFLIVRRSQHLTMLEMFDTPMMEVNCPQRNESIVPTQALTLLHGPFSQAIAEALAARILSSAPAEMGGRIEYAFRLMYTRYPTPSETESIRGFLLAYGDDAVASSPTASSVETETEAAWVQVALVMLNSNEFLFVP